jgi:hypothetical protein
MSDVVTTGVVRDGMTSRRGITEPSVVHYPFLHVHDLQTLWD